MRTLDLFRIAMEALLANKMRAGLTMLGMIIGVGAVVLLVSIGNGAKTYITREFEGMGTNLIMVQPGKTDKRSGFGPPVGLARHNLYLRDVEAIEQSAYNIEAVTGVLFGMVSVKNHDRISNVNVLGSNEKMVRIFNLPIGQGSFFNQEEDETGRRVVVLGYNVARNLFPDEVAVGQLVKINESEHRVIGITEKRGSSLGMSLDDMVFVPTKAAMRILNEERLLGIRAKAKSRSGVQHAVDEIREILKARQDGEEDFTVLTQVSMLESMGAILGMLTLALGGIAMISMIVGGIGIMNIMLVSVTERTREIGIRRAVGARQRDILGQFLVEAVTLSVVGGGIGLLGSLGLTYLASWIYPSFDMRAPGWVLLPAFLLSTFAGVVFGVWPARKGARIETIDALRYE